MKIKRHRHANERAKNRTKNETHLNSHKETNHKDMIEWTTSLINIRKKEKNELWKNCYSWNLKLIYLVDWFCGVDIWDHEWFFAYCSFINADENSITCTMAKRPFFIKRDYLAPFP